MNFETACKLIGAPLDLVRAKKVASFTLGTATRQCPLRIKVAAKFIMEM